MNSRVHIWANIAVNCQKLENLKCCHQKQHFQMTTSTISISPKTQIWRNTNISNIYQQTSKHTQRPPSCVAYGLSDQPWEPRYVSSAGAWHFPRNKNSSIARVSGRDTPCDCVGNLFRVLLQRWVVEMSGSDFVWDCSFCASDFWFQSSIDWCNVRWSTDPLMHKPATLSEIAGRSQYSPRCWLEMSSTQWKTQRWRAARSRAAVWA